MTRANPATPGSTDRVGGSKETRTSRSGSSPSRAASIWALPRLSMARSWRARRLPCDVRGMSSADGARKRPTWRLPSSTVEPSGSSRERTMIPNPVDPDRVVAARGGRNVIRALPSAPGKSERVGGSTAAHGPASPRTSIANSSTTVPAFLTVTTTEASSPGSTTALDCWSEAMAPIVSRPRRAIRQCRSRGRRRRRQSRGTRSPRSGRR